MKIAVKRAYDPPAPGDGYRILVDRLWPRGLTKRAAGIDLWAKDAAPSNELRHWYHHDATRWATFRRRYLAELRAHPDAVRRLLACARRGRLTLVFAARETRRNNATVLKAYLERLARSTPRTRL